MGLPDGPTGGAGASVELAAASTGATGTPVFSGLGAWGSDGAMLPAAVELEGGVELEEAAAAGCAAGLAAAGWGG